MNCCQFEFVCVFSSQKSVIEFLEEERNTCGKLKILSNVCETIPMCVKSE